MYNLMKKKGSDILKGKLHSYNIKGFENDKIIVFHVLISYAISIGLIYLFKPILDNIPTYIQPIIEIPSVIGVYEFIKYIVNKYLWKTKLFSKLLKVPNLNGIWNGVIETNYNGNDEKIDVKMTIKQDFDKILIIYDTEKSISYSTIAEINIENEYCTEIFYQYINEPKYKYCGELNIHHGSADYTLTVEGEIKRCILQ